MNAALIAPRDFRQGSPSALASELGVTSGHDFSRAVTAGKSVWLQPLGSELCGRDTDEKFSTEDILQSRLGKKRSKENPMRIERTHLLILAVGCLLALFAPSQAGAQMFVRSPHFEFGGDYNWIHSNAPPGGCGCFSANGGDGWASWRVWPGLSLVGEGGMQRASNVEGTSAGIKMISFLGGPRFTLTSRHRLEPFAKVLVGGAHASGELTPLTSGVSGSATVFAMTAGGGADFALTPTFAIRLIDADYFYTRFDNGTNDHQNNVQLAAGIVIRIGRN
jgi:peptidoglycan-associated lipoprotein